MNDISLGLMLRLEIGLMGCFTFHYNPSRGKCLVVNFRGNILRPYSVRSFI